MKAMQSLKSRGYVRENFSWQWYYYYLTDEGITYLRDYLAIDADVQPETRKKAAPRPSVPGARGDRGDRGERGERGGFRGERRQFSDDRKLGSAPGSYEPNFRRGGERREGGGFGERSGRGFGRGRGGGSYGRGGFGRSGGEVVVE